MKIEGDNLAYARKLRIRQHYAPQRISVELRKRGLSVTVEDVRQALDITGSAQFRPRAMQVLDYLNRKPCATVDDVARNLNMKREHAIASLRGLVKRGMLRVEQIEGVDIFEKAA